MLKKYFTTARLSRAGIICSLYIVISLVCAPISSGAVQVRLSEALTILAIIFPEAVPALFIGCALSNMITGCAPYDVIFGSVVTLIAGTCSFFCAKIIKNVPLKIIVGGFFPIVLNAFILPLIWQWCYGFIEYVYMVQVGILAIGQSISVYLVGTPLYFVAVKIKNKMN